MIRVDDLRVKIFADGTMYCQTAALSHPFLGAAEDHRIFRTPEAEIRETARRALDGGLDVAVHAIGDAGVARVLDVYEGLLRDRPDLDPPDLPQRAPRAGRDHDVREPPVGLPRERDQIIVHVRTTVD